MSVEPVRQDTIKFREMADLLDKCSWFEPSYGSAEISDYFHGSQNELNQAALDVARKFRDAGAEVKAEIIHDGAFFRVTGRTPSGGKLSWLTNTGDRVAWRALTKRINRRQEQEQNQ